MSSTTQLIRAILVEGKARTQSEIRNALEEKGELISQPKVSRLLHKIGAVKLVDDEGKTHYRLPHESGLIHELSSVKEKEMVQQLILQVIANESLIIIHTTPGAASMVARILDQHGSQLDIIGTIAGDDSIFIALKDSSKIPDVVHSINELLNL